MVKTVLAKSLDHVNMIACILNDVYNALGIVVPPRYQRLTIDKIANRVKREGYGFFTKSLPRLGKSFDKALLGQSPLDCTGFRKEPGSQIPKMFGNLFKRVFDLNGVVLPNPCVESIRSLRQILFVYYKYELPNDRTLDQKAIQAFKDAENDVRQDVAYLVQKFGAFGGRAIPPNSGSLGQHCQDYPGYKEEVAILCKARRLVYELFAGLDISSIVPHHGPGAVSTKETGSQKYVFTRMNPRAQMYFPFDKHMFVNADHLCDTLHTLESVEVKESPAQVVLVPKDSRGPRVISCEPLENQWLQQGIMRKLVRWIERHPLTRNSVRFTDQEPNRMAALAGSYHGQLATLDLKEASDRVSVWLVEQLFPEPLLGALLATRSLATKLPDGEVIPLAKFAPMGSACCFPVLAICVWALLRAGRAGADGKTVFVYGDDVIVETAEAAHAIEQLEAFGLHVNRDKSCTSGLFRESCGMDAYAGVDVTPVRFRTVWSSTPAAGPYESWIAYANRLFHSGYKTTANYIADSLQATYGPVPIELGATMTEVKVNRFTVRYSFSVGYPCLTFDSIGMLPVRTRNTADLPDDHKAAGYQRLQKYVRTVTSPRVEEVQDGWTSLFRFFTEKCDEEDDELSTWLLSLAARLVQMNCRSTEVMEEVFCDDVIVSNAEAAQVADEALMHDPDSSLLPFISALSGIPLPVVHECVRVTTLRAYHMQYPLRAENPLNAGSAVGELNEYVKPRSSKLRKAWR